MDTARDEILRKVRGALRRGEAGPGAVWAPPEVALSARPASAGEFRIALERLGGQAHHAASPAELRAVLGTILAGREAVLSGAPWLDGLALETVPGVRRAAIAGAGGDSPNGEPEDRRAAFATAAVGITSASYALSDTGTLAMLGDQERSRLASLLPPCHVAIVRGSTLLGGLDDLLEALDDPCAAASSLVLITGPSRTGDIELILVRGVHGPGELHAVFAEWL